MSEIGLGQRHRAGRSVERRIAQAARAGHVVSDGVLLPGDALDEEALAQRFGVSRTPVREALLQLSVRGLVSIAPRAGIYVSRLSIPELAARCACDHVARRDGGGLLGDGPGA